MAEHLGNNCAGIDFIDGVPLEADHTPVSLILQYAAAGYDFVAVTEHYGNGQYEDHPLIWDRTDTSATGVVHICDSMEDTASDSHILGIGFDREAALLPDWMEGDSAPDSDLMTKRTRVHRIQRMGHGMAIAAHPNVERYRWTPGQVLHSGAMGVEVYNSGSDWFNHIYHRSDPLALHTWDQVLRMGHGIWGTAGDDYTVPWPQFDGGYVMAVCNRGNPSKDDIMWALKHGSFYACKARLPWVDAPTINGYWPETEEGAVHLLLPSDDCRVRFATARGGELLPTSGPVASGDNWEYTYSWQSADRYVRAEVRDWMRNVSWTQPIRLERNAQDTGVWETAAAGASVSAALDPPLVIDVADAHLEVSTPQSQIQHVYGRTLGTFERPEALPPMGYVGECYEFLPEATLDGVNTLTVAYNDADVQLLPETALTIYRYDEAEETWPALPTLVDEDLNAATAEISTLGIYALSGEIAEDTTPPTVSIDAPPDGSSQSGVIVISASATDDNGVASVRFFLDAIALGHDSYGADGWTWEVDLSVYPPGSHVITAEAEDASGNTADASVTVTTSSTAATPGITIASPESDASYWIWEEVEVSGVWSDDDPLVMGLLAVDDAPMSIFSDEGGGSWQATLALGPGMEGNRQLRAIGLDPYENRSEASQPITLRFFSDVPQDHWAYLDIYKTAKTGIVQGYPEGDYKPDLAVTRDQMAVYICRAMAGGDVDVPTGPATAAFDDVPTDHWAYRYVEYAVSHDVVAGYDDGLYHPSEAVDRGQMAVFVARAKGWVSIDDDLTTAPELFPDVPAGFWAGTAIQACVDNGVVHGYDDGYYRPDVIVTRDQMAVYVARAFELLL